MIETMTKMFLLFFENCVDCVVNSFNLVFTVKQSTTKVKITRHFACLFRTVTFEISRIVVPAKCFKPSFVFDVLASVYTLTARLGQSFKVSFSGIVYDRIVFSQSSSNVPILWIISSWNIYDNPHSFSRARIFLKPATRLLFRKEQVGDKVVCLRNSK